MEWIEINGLRGWSGERVTFQFRVVAIVGENGAGKSTILQAAASLYQTGNKHSTFYASGFFPDTPWETISGVSIQGSIRKGQTAEITNIRKPTKRWRGNPDREKREVVYLDLRRSQPISTKTGYARLAKGSAKEKNSTKFDQKRLATITEGHFE